MRVKWLKLMTILVVSLVVTGCEQDEKITCKDNQIVKDNRCVSVETEDVLSEFEFVYDKILDEIKKSSSIQITKTVTNMENFQLETIEYHIDFETEYMYVSPNTLRNEFVSEVINGDRYHHTINQFDVVTMLVEDDFSNVVPSFTRFGGLLTNPSNVEISSTEQRFTVQGESAIFDQELGYESQETYSFDVEVATDYQSLIISTKALMADSNQMVTMQFEYVIGEPITRLDLTDSSYFFEEGFDYISLFELERTKYQLDIVLDDIHDTIQVEGKILYLNETGSLDDVVLMLFPNAVSSEYHNMDFLYLRVNGVEIDTMNQELYEEGNQAIRMELLETSLIGETIVIEFSYTANFWNYDRFYHQDQLYNVNK